MKLLLFDIDGTLTHHIGDSQVSLDRFAYAVKKMFGIKLNMSVDEYMRYNGFIDRATIWELVKDRGITRAVYEEKFPLFSIHASEYFNLHNPLYEEAEGAQELLGRLEQREDISLGVITGNVEAIAWWKLKRAGLDTFFRFGLFGEEAKNRIELAGLAFPKGKIFFKKDFAPRQITIIGDTIHDVRCAKAIGANIILILTGQRNSEIPKDEKPDLIVRSLKDPAIGAFLGLN